MRVNNKISVNNNIINSGKKNQGNVKVPFLSLFYLGSNLKN